MKKILIIIPTYNERENIKTLVKKIFKHTKSLNVNILIVDDNSPDGTGMVAKELTKKYKNKVFLIQQANKRGLGTAYIKGFIWGLKKNYDSFIEMDADFSHNPKYLPQMIKLSYEYDFIIGSRYIKGGGINGWTKKRKLLSRFGSLYAKIILCTSINDLTGGYNLWNRNVLEAIDIQNIFSEGYSFQIEMKYRAYKKKFKFLEFPIIFEDRAYGISKMSKKIMIEAIIAVWKLKFKL